MPHEHLPLLPLVLDKIPQGLRQALAQEGIPYRDLRPGAAEGRFVLFDSRILSGRVAEAGQVLIDVDRFRAGWEYDPFDALVDTQAESRQWPIGPFRLVERVARFDKRDIRRRILRALRDALERAGGIWLCVAPFPFPYRSAFNFRLDHDNYDAADFDATMAALAGSEGATSHYVNASAYESAPEALARLRGLDVGSHGYWHHTYQTAEENHRNIGRGIEVLRKAGIEPSGFVAPHGQFNDGLLTALVGLGIAHSSDFGLVYDELPTLVGTSNLLEIPIHPICLGLFLDAAAGQRDAGGESSPAAAAEAAIEHFEHVARARYRLGEPIFLYGHPDGRLGRHPEVLRHVLGVVANFATLWRTTLSDMNAWWRARAGIELTVTRADDGLLVTAHRLAPPYRLAIEYWRGRHVAVIPLEEPAVRLVPSALAYESRIAEPMVQPVRVDQPEGLRGQIRRMIDWERVTPVEEIPTSTWRNVAKRTLRKWWKT